MSWDQKQILSSNEAATMNATVSSRFANKPTRGQSSHELDDSTTSQFAEMM